MTFGGGGVSQHNLIPPLMYQLTKIDVPHSITILYTMCVYSQKGATVTNFGAMTHFPQLT